jgi:mono/diheme cytochrome c family protein
MRVRIASTLFVEIMITAALASGQTAPKAFAGSRGNATSGEQVFKDQCTVCHSVKPGENGVGPSLYGEISGPHPKKTDEQVRKIVMEGLGKMPDFRDDISSDDLDNLLAYIRTRPPEGK